MSARHFLGRFGMDDAVECEVCHAMIPFDVYAEHIEDCPIYTFLMMGDLQDFPVRYPPVQTNEYDLWSQLEELVGKVEIGIENVDLVLREAPPHDDVCPICLESCGTQVETLCGHVFCKACISRWLGSSVRCPVCITDLREKTHAHQMSSTASSSKSTAASLSDPLSISAEP